MQNGGRILIVDDCDGYWAFYKDALVEFFGVAEEKIFIFPSPEEVLALLEEEQDDTISLVITDLRMSDMNGLTFTRELRKRGMRSFVMMITGSLAPPFDSEMVYSAGVDYLVEKGAGMLECIQYALRVTNTLPVPEGLAA